MATIKDVAARAGVSVSTVSHVINKTRFVSDDMTLKVMDAVEKLNYYQNAKARGLVTGKSKIVGLIVSDITNPFFPELVRGVEKSAHLHGYEVFLSNTDYDADRIAILVRRLIEQKVDGVIILTTEMEQSLITKLTENQIPVVLLDWGLTDYLVSNIKENFEVGIEQAIKHLVELGHKDIAFISGPLKLKTAVTRKEAFLAAISKYEKLLGEPIIVEGDFRIEGGEMAVSTILSNNRRPTAIFASNDLMAIGAIKGIKSIGLKIPDDISVIGLDDIFIASHMDPPLTTVNLPRYQIGKTAWKLLYSLIANKQESGIEEVIETSLIVRGTVTVPPQV